MILYSIRRISDGKFYCHFDGIGRIQWRSSPIYWRTAEHIWKNLGRLCSEFYYWEGPHKGTRIAWLCRRKAWRNFDAAKLAGYEVIETNVRVLGEKQIPAAEFVLPDDLAEMDLMIA